MDNKFVKLKPDSLSELLNTNYSILYTGNLLNTKWIQYPPKLEFQLKNIEDRLNEVSSAQEKIRILEHEQCEREIESVTISFYKGNDRAEVEIINKAIKNWISVQISLLSKQDALKEGRPIRNRLNEEINDNSDFGDGISAKIIDPTEVRNLAIFDLFTTDIERKLRQCYKTLNDIFIDEDDAAVFSSLFKVNGFQSKVKWIGSAKELHYFIIGIENMLVSSNDKWIRASNSFLKKKRLGTGYEVIKPDSIRKPKNKYPIKDKRLDVLNKAIRFITQ